MRHTATVFLRGMVKKMFLALIAPTDGEEGANKLTCNLEPLSRARKTWGKWKVSLLDHCKQIIYTELSKLLSKLPQMSDVTSDLLNQSGGIFAQCQ